MAAIEENFRELVLAPTAEQYRSTLKLLADHAGYDPYSHDLSNIVQLATLGHFQRVMERRSAALPNLILSPRFHQILAVAATRLGDKDAAQLELLLSMRLIEAILLTGDGSVDRPYLVARVEDEYDVLRHLQKEMKGQSTGTNNDRLIDTLHCKDGSTVTFDVTIPRQWLNHRMGAR